MASSMAEARENWLAHAVSLKGSSLDPIEVKWINTLCFTIYHIFGRLYAADEAEMMAREACIVALNRLVRGNRFPTSFSVLHWDNLTTAQTPMKCDYANAWESNSTPSPAEGNFHHERGIMIGWMTHYAGEMKMEAIQAQLGTCMFVEDPAGQTLPCMALASALPCVNQVFLSTDWSYCPLGQVVSLKRGLAWPYKGFFELRESIALPASKSLAIRSSHFSGRNIPSSLALSIDAAYDHTTKRFRSACLPPKRPNLSLYGQLSRKTSLLPVTSTELGLLLELKSKKHSTVNITILDTEHTRHVIAAANLLKIGSEILITHLKTSIVRPPLLRPQPRFVATSESIIIPLGDEHTSIQSSEALNDAKRPKLVESADSGLLHSYSGRITRVYNSHCMELDGRYIVCAHRLEQGLGLLRKGHAVALHFVHPIYDDKRLSGLGLCSQSTIEVLEFSTMFEKFERPQIEVRNSLGEFPCLELALYAEKMRLQLLQHCEFVDVIGLPSLVELLFNWKGEKWRNGVTSKRDVYQECFAHDSGFVGGNLGCRASGMEYTAFPRMMSIDFFCNLTLSSKLETPSSEWAFEVSNPALVLEQTLNRTMIGQLTHETKVPYVQSNYIWFQSLNGASQVPIVVTGVRSHHLRVPCRLTSFALVKENTTSHYGEAGHHQLKGSSNAPFDLYFVCDIAHIQFMWDPRPEDLQLTQKPPPNAQRTPDLCFQLIKKDLPRYQQPHQGTTISLELTIVPMSGPPNTWDTSARTTTSNSHLSVSNTYHLQLYPLLLEGAFYRISNVSPPFRAKNAQRWECTTATSLVEIVPPSSSNSTLPSNNTRALGDATDTVTEFTIRDCLYKKSPAFKSLIAFKAVIVSRYHEPMIASMMGVNFASRFIGGCETEVRSNAGDVTLVLRALDTPDTATAYFKSGRISLPLGLVPGMVIEVKRARAELRSNRNLHLLLGARNPSCNIRIIGFDPSVCDTLNLTYWEESRRLPKLKSGLEVDPNLNRSIGGSTGLRSMLIDNIDWLEGEKVLYRHLIEVEPKAAYERRTFRTRVNILKFYDFSLETRCRTCSRLSIRGTCTFGCEDRRMSIRVLLTGTFHDGTARALFSAEGSSVWPLLALSSRHRNTLTSMAERLGSIKFANKQLTLLGKQPQDASWDDDDEEDDDQDDEPRNMALDDYQALKALQRVLFGHVGDQCIIIGAYFAKTRDDSLPFPDLPYAVTHHKPSPEEIESGVPKARLSRPLPSIDIVWACKMLPNLHEECLALINSLST